MKQQGDILKQIDRNSIGQRHMSRARRKTNRPVKPRTIPTMWDLKAVVLIGAGSVLSGSLTRADGLSILKVIIVVVDLEII